MRWCSFSVSAISSRVSRLRAAPTACSSEPRSGGKRAVQAHLIFAELALKQRALVEQPGQHMHHPGGGLQPLGRQRETHEGVLARQRLARAGGKHRAHFIRQNQRLGVERLDDRARKVGGAGHIAPQATSPRASPPYRLWLLSKQFLVSSREGTELLATMSGREPSVRARLRHHAMISGSSVVFDNRDLVPQPQLALLEAGDLELSADALTRPPRSRRQSRRRGRDARS